MNHLSYSLAAKMALLGLLLFAACAGAQYRLELVAEVELPENADWDLQHWANDSSYGWAAVAGTTIVYCTDIETAPVITLPMSVPNNPYPDWNQGVFAYVDIYGSAIQPKVFVFGKISDFYYGYYLRPARIDLEAGEGILPHLDHSIWTDDWGVVYWAGGSRSDIGTQVWPPPPSEAAYALFGSYWEHSSDGAGNWAEGGRSEAYCYRLFDEYERFSLNRMTSLAPFARFDSLQLTGSGNEWFLHNFYVSGPGSFSYTSAGLISFYRGDSIQVDTVCARDTSGVGNADPFGFYQCRSQKIAAVSSAEGVRRVVRADGVCLQETVDGFEPDWFYPDGNWQSLESARLPGSQDERLLAARPSRFDVYDASDGSFIGSTTAYAGGFRYLLKTPEGVSEFVTYDEDAQIVRVYRPTLSTGLTIAQDLATEELRFNWDRFPSAANYKLWYHRPPPFDEPVLIATVTDTSFALPLPEEDIGFYSVEVGY